MSEKIEPVAWRWAMPDLAGRKWDFAEVKQLGGNAEPLYSQAAIEALQAERDEADGALIDRFRSGTTGMFNFPDDVVKIIRRLDKAEAELSTLREKVGALSGKYGNVLTPFVQLMERELHANSGKGDRPGWLSMERKTGLLEIFYHLAKLQKAAKDDDTDGIREYGADVANMAMMLVDICDALPVLPTSSETVNSRDVRAHLRDNIAELSERMERAERLIEANQLDDAIDCLRLARAALTNTDSDVTERECPNCHRHIMIGNAPGSWFLARCGNRLSRIEECTLDSCPPTQIAR